MAILKSNKLMDNQRSYLQKIVDNSVYTTLSDKNLCENVIKNGSYYQINSDNLNRIAKAYSSEVKQFKIYGL